jgi:hypothetical protein
MREYWSEKQKAYILETQYIKEIKDSADKNLDDLECKNPDCRCKTRKKLNKDLNRE